MAAIRSPNSASSPDGDERVEHRGLEVEVLVHPAEDHVELPDDQLEQVDLRLQHVQDPLLDRAARRPGW